MLTKLDMDPIVAGTAQLACDEQLVAMLRTEQRGEALAELDARYGKRIQSFVVGMVRDSHLAQDVVQEVFERVLLKNDLYRPGTNFRAWLFEVARNQALSALRSKQRLPRPVSSLTPADSVDPLENLVAPVASMDLEEQEFMHAFQVAVDGLPAHYRQVFELCVRQGMAYQEAGKQLGLPTGTVAIRIMRARKRLFSTLQHHIGRLRRPPACFQV